LLRCGAAKVEAVPVVAVDSLWDPLLHEVELVVVDDPI